MLSCMVLCNLTAKPFTFLIFWLGLGRKDGGRKMCDIIASYADGLKQHLYDVPVMSIYAAIFYTLEI